MNQTANVSDLPSSFLSNHQLVELTNWRHTLHQHPELSGEERETAARAIEMLAPTKPDETVSGLGGHGVAFVYDSGTEGKTTLLRCELDALPIMETGAVPYCSLVDGKGHLCGHDGHMTILAAVGFWLSENRPEKGRIVLLFQPAEEDGSGAAKVLADEAFKPLIPDHALSLHNMPGLPIGFAALAPGPANCASVGMKIRLSGKTAHASEPENGISPAPAVAGLIGQLNALQNKVPVKDDGFARVTVTHVKIGEPAFGIAPGDGELWATLRTVTDHAMESLVGAATQTAESIAQENGLTLDISWHDEFRACHNHDDAVAILGRALDAEGISWNGDFLPMRGSEDFGRFADVTKSAMFLLGAGENRPFIHNPDYDFPDELIPMGARIFIRALQELNYY